jgi:hypothetical protein
LRKCLVHQRRQFLHRLLSFNRNIQRKLQPHDVTF